MKNRTQATKIVSAYTVIAAMALAVGETLVLVCTDKYWPLSLDDYIVVFALLATLRLPEGRRWPAQMAVWAAATGNLYAILFSRLDPVHGSGERIGLVVVALAAAVIGLVISTWLWRLRDPAGAE